MKPVSIALLSLVFAVSMAAQDQANRNAAPTSLSRMRLIESCPVGMYASQGIWDHTLAIREGIGNQTSGQRLLLNLKDFGASRINSAAVKVRGLSGKDRMLKAQSMADDAWDSVRTLRVSFAAQTDGSVSADLWIPGFTSVTSIELDEIAYADGSVWKAPGSGACRIRPDPRMLVTSR